MKSWSDGEISSDVEEIDEEETEKETEEEEEESSWTMDESGESSEERGEREWTPSYADEVDQVIERFNSVFGTSDAHGFLRQFIKVRLL